MKVLLVNAHPLPASLNARLTDHLCKQLRKQGHDVDRLDLYANDYDPRLNADERSRYYQASFDDDVRLSEAEGLIFVFPTWWFGMPAILKGWIDRSFLPGVAYDHAPGGAPMIARLRNLRAVLAVTTLGAPWWYDFFVARRPVKRSLKWGVVKPCAPKARFKLLSLYQCESLERGQIIGFETRLTHALHSLFPKDGENQP